ncbi:hypothetical protein SDC9_183701 [bioreactor metagenome]|uniref:Uncharacterized protein n=1 Tax=bioreactor metagenome TaxID=1076179 RepID=A0A645HKP8_9ZZZZ
MPADPVRTGSVLGVVVVAVVVPVVLVAAVVGVARVLLVLTLVVGFLGLAVVAVVVARARTAAQRVLNRNHGVGPRPNPVSFDYLPVIAQ